MRRSPTCRVTPHDSTDAPAGAYAVPFNTTIAPPLPSPSRWSVTRPLSRTFLIRIDGSLLKMVTVSSASRKNQTGAVDGTPSALTVVSETSPLLHRTSRAGSVGAQASPTHSGKVYAAAHSGSAVPSPSHQARARGDEWHGGGTDGAAASD